MADGATPLTPESSPTVRFESSGKFDFSSVPGHQELPSISAYEPSLAERLKSIFTENIPRFSSKTVYNPEYGSNKLIAPEEALTPGEQRRHPIATELLRIPGELTTPENIAMQAILPGASEAALPMKAAKFASTAVAGLFTEEALRGAYHSIPAVKEAIDAGDYNEAERVLTKAVAPAMLLLAGTAAHVAGGKRAPVEEPRALDFSSIEGHREIEPQREPKDFNQEDENVHGQWGVDQGEKSKNFSTIGYNPDTDSKYFIAPNGSAFGSLVDHIDLLPDKYAALRGTIEDDEKAITEYLKKTGSVRASVSSNPRTGLSLDADFEKKPTDAQINEIYQMARKHQMNIYTNYEGPMDPITFVRSMRGKNAIVPQREPKDFSAVPGHKKIEEPGQGEMRSIAQEFNEKRGLEPINFEHVGKDPRGALVADAYDAATHSPNDPKVRASYDALIRDLKEQWEFLKSKGYTITSVGDDPLRSSGGYISAEDMVRDIRENKHLNVWEGGRPPEDHPLSAIDPDTKLPYNTLFRAVHDMMGHAIEGHDFSEPGEENAYNVHSQMFSKEAIPALLTETKGQASWFFNNRNVREGKPAGDFPSQKATILPEQFHDRDPFAKIAALHNERDGATYNLRDGDLNGKDLYAVSAHPDRTEELDHAPSADEIRDFADRNKDLLSRPDRSLGTWKASDERHVLDVSATVPTEAEAMRLARENGQEAIYHLGGRGEIPVPPPERGEGMEAQREPKDLHQNPTYWSRGGILEDSKGKAFLSDSGEFYGVGQEHEDTMVEEGIAPSGPESEDEMEEHEELLHHLVDQHTLEGNIRVAGLDKEDSPLYVQISKAPTASQRAALGKQIYKQGGVIFDVTPRGFLGKNAKVISGEARTPGEFWKQVDAVLKPSKGIEPQREPKDLTQAAESLGFARVAQHLTKEEAKDLRESTQQKILQTFDELPPDKEFIDAANAGLAKRGWYRRAAKSLRALFGEDADTFAGILAATSPRQSVTNNLKMALDIYGSWIERGRPMDDKALGKLAEMGHLPARYDNIVRAFKGEELSGDKVAAFHGNLTGSMRNVTNDTWMAIFGGLPEGALGKRAPYLAMTAKVRDVAKQMGWTPAEVQETVWSFTKALVEAAGEKHALADVLPIMNDEMISQRATEFAELLRSDDDVRGKLKQVGIDLEAIERAGAARARRAPATPLQKRVETGPGSALRAATERIDAARRAGRTALKEEPRPELFPEREPGADEDIEPQREPKRQLFVPRNQTSFGNMDWETPTGLIDLEKVEPIRNRDSGDGTMGDKPDGGVWTSTFRKEKGSEWLEWVRSNEPEWEGERGSIYKVPRSANVATVTNQKTYRDLIEKYPRFFSRNKVGIDFEALSKDYDGLRFTFDGISNNRYSGGRMPKQVLGHDPVEPWSWDVESTLWFKPEILKLHEEGAVNDVIKSQREPKSTKLSDALVDKFGTTHDPLRAGFLLRDGRMVPLGSFEHDRMLQLTWEDLQKQGKAKEAWNSPWKEGPGYGGPLRTDFVDAEGAVRTRQRTSRRGNEVVFSVPKYGVSDEQLANMRDAIELMGENGSAVVMEVAEPHGKSSLVERPRPEDIDKMLREIGAHPESQKEAKSFSAARVPGDFERVNRELRSALSDPKIQELAKHVGVARALVTKIPEANGMNVGKAWYDHVRSRTPGVEGEINERIARNLKHDLPYVGESEIKTIVDAMKEGNNDTIFLDPQDARKRTVVHEILHSFTGKEVKPHGEANIPQHLVIDLFDQAGLAKNLSNIEWASKPNEFITETMTQYFLGNLEKGGRLSQLAEAVLRHAKDPWIRNLIGTTLGLALAMKGMLSLPEEEKKPRKNRPTYLLHGRPGSSAQAGAQPI